MEKKKKNENLDVRAARHNHADMSILNASIRGIICAAEEGKIAVFRTVEALDATQQGPRNIGQEQNSMSGTKLARNPVILLGSHRERYSVETNDQQNKSYADGSFLPLAQNDCVFLGQLIESRKNLCKGPCFSIKYISKRFGRAGSNSTHTFPSTLRQAARAMLASRRHEGLTAIYSFSAASWLFPLCPFHLSHLYFPCGGLDYVYHGAYLQIEHTGTFGIDITDCGLLIPMER